MILDIILLLLIALWTFIGYKRGFVKVIIKLVIVALSLLLALLLKDSVSDFICNEFHIDNVISDAIEGKLIGLTEKDENIKITTDISIFNDTIDDINNASQDTKQAVIKTWADKLAVFLTKGISFIVIFIVVAITIGIIGLILGTVVKLPVLKTLNGVLGAIFEFVVIMLWINIILAVISLISPLDIITTVVRYINSSYITKWLFDNNIIIFMLGKGI